MIVQTRNKVQTYDTADWIRDRSAESISWYYVEFNGYNYP